MGNNSFDKKSIKQYNYEKDISLKINLKKVCYFPGDSIKGTFSLEPKIKSKNKPTVFQKPQSIITLNQREFYSYQGDGGESIYHANVEKDTQIISLTNPNSEYIGHNIYQGISIPFKIKLPTTLYPTCVFDGNYTIHLLSVEFPEIQAKKTLIIIIKNVQVFNYKNCLYKSPFIVSEDISKKSGKNFKGGDIFCNIELPRNGFNYYESVPFDIKLDLSGVDLELSSIKVSINRKTNLNKKNDKKCIISKTTEIISKEIKLEQLSNKKNFEIKDTIQFPTESKYVSVFPPNVYRFLEECKIIELGFDLKKISLYPHCLGSLISIEYYLTVEINYKPFSISKDLFNLPLDFYLVESPEVNESLIGRRKSLKELIKIDGLLLKIKNDEIKNKENINDENKKKNKEDIQDINVDQDNDDEHEQNNHESFLDFGEKIDINAESSRKLVDLGIKRKKSSYEGKTPKP